MLVARPASRRSASGPSALIPSAPSLLTTGSSGRPHETPNNFPATRSRARTYFRTFEMRPHPSPIHTPSQRKTVIATFSRSCRSGSTFPPHPPFSSHETTLTGDGLQGAINPTMPMKVAQPGQGVNSGWISPSSPSRIPRQGCRDPRRPAFSLSSPAVEGSR